MKRQDNMSRRGFLTGAAATGALAAVGALTGCSPKASAETAQGNATGAPVENPQGASVFDKPESVAGKVKETKDYDAVVVGGGNSGVVGALELAQLGAKVLLIEQTTACTKYAGDIDALDRDRKSVV